MTGKARKRDAFDIKVRDIFEANRKIYGSRRISKELKRLGINAGRYKVTLVLTLMTRHNAITG
jgi:transposase InsO family protein